MKNITVNVTREDIKMGGRNCWNCPIHRAVKRATGFPYVIGWVNVYADRFMGKWVCKLPDVATEFIEALHNGKSVSPFTFTLEVPDELAAVSREGKHAS